MRFLVAVVFGEAVLSLLLNDVRAVLILGPLALLAAVAAIRGEALLLAPLLVALPMIPLMVREQLFRFLGALVLLALILLALSEITHRHKGAPLSLSRHLFWYLAGCFVLFVALFAASADHIVPAPVLLLASVLFAAGGVWLGRTVAERARAAHEHRIPRLVDAATIGVLFTEMLIALAFLPLTPIPLAALSTVTLWLFIRMLIASRLNQLTFARGIGLLINAGVMAVAIVTPSLLF